MVGCSSGGEGKNTDAKPGGERNGAEKGASISCEMADFSSPESEESKKGFGLDKDRVLRGRCGAGTNSVSPWALLSALRVQRVVAAASCRAP